MRSDIDTTQEMKQSTLALLFSTPAILIIASTILVPFAYTVFLSLHKWKLKMKPPYDFIGLENYTDLLEDDKFWGSFSTTAMFAIIAVVVIVITGILIALLLNEEFPGRGLLRGLLLVPWAIPAVVSGMLWKWLLDPSYGILNAIALQLGLIPKYQAWLSEMPGALIWTVIAYSWIHIPLAALLLLSGLQTISGSLYEAAIVDGANMWQRFTKITFPLLRPTLTVVVIFETIFAFKVFDTIFVLTAGGPGRSTTVLGWKIYTETFRKLDFGAGSALALLLGSITMLIAILFYAFLDKGVEQ
jgi:ABC-type sugar transport system permease subunit